MIEHLSYTVEPASCGLEALEKVRNSTTPFMAIMMDIKMHDIYEFETTKITRELEQEKGCCNIIIAVIAYALAGDRKYCLKVGMNDYINKPI